MGQKKFTKILKKILKVIGWFILSVLLLLVVFIFSLRLPSVQEFVTGKALDFFKSKVNTEASIGRLYVGFPKSIVIEDIYVEDQQKDTLLYSHYIEVNTDLWELLDNKFQVNDLDIDNLVANIYNTSADSTFNYQFIADAFTSQDSTQAPADTTQSKSFEFSIKEISIKEAKVAYDDLFNGSSLQVDVGDLYTFISTFDLINSQIIVDDIELKNSEGSFKILKPSTEDTDTTSTKIFDVQGKSLLVNNVKFTFEDQPGNLKLNTDIGEAGIEVDSMNLERQVYVAKKIDLKKTFVSIDQFTSSDSTAQSQQDTTSESDTTAIQILAGTARANIVDVDFRLYNHNYEKTEGFDPNHMWFQKLNADLKNIVFENGYANGVIKGLSGIENGGFKLKELETEFKYAAEESMVKSLHLVTEHSQIDGEMAIGYPSLEALQTNLNALKIDASIQRSRIDFEDVFYFQPALKQSLSYFTGSASQVIFQGDIKGSLNDLEVNGVKAEALKNTRLAVNGIIKGLPDINNMYVDLKLKKLSTTSSDISTVLPDTLLPQNLTIPQEISLQGNVKGGMNDFSSKIDIKTSLGGATADVNMNMKDDSLYHYSGAVEVDSFNIGKLLQQENTMGHVTFNIKAEGKGFSMEDLDTKLEGKVSSFLYNDYSYENMSINGVVKSEQFKGKLGMDDPNVDFDFNGLVNLNDSIPHYEFTLDMRTLDLYALNFAREEIKVRGKVESDIRMASVDKINGTLSIKDFVMGKGTHVYQMDTFLLSSTATEDSTNISIKSNIINAEFAGNFDIVTLPQVLEQHFNRYYALQGVEDVTELTPQSFDFDINILQPGFFTNLLIPELTELRPGEIKGSYNSELWELNLDINMHRLAYGSNQVDSLGIEVNSNEATLEYLVKIASIGNGTIKIDHVNWRGNVEADHVKTELLINDNKGENKYMFGGIFISGEKYSRFQFTPGEFILNYKEWEVRPSNSIDLYPKGIWIKNMEMSEGGQSISIESQINEQNDSTLAVNITDFNLGALGKLEETDKYLINGIFNGEFHLLMEQAKFAFTSDVDIKDFSYLGDTLGNVNVVASNEGNSKYNLNLDIKNKFNNVKVDGYYLADSVPKIYLDANLVNLELASIQSFTMGQLTEMEGSINGNLKIRGTTSEPDITGRLNFDESSFNVTYLKSVFSLNNEYLNFTKAGIAFNNFNIKDANGHTATIDGEVTTSDYTFYKFDLRLKTQDFLFLNTEKKDNELYYGHIELNSNATITGNSDQPNVDIDVSMSKGSELTYVIPEQQITEQQTENIVQWIDKDIQDDPFYQQFQTEEQKQDSVDAQIKGLNISANINIDNNNTLNVVIDPVTGDKLSVKGNSTLKLNIEPSGEMSLAGRYEVYEGSYNMNFYGLVKREFRLERGSYLLWTGDVLNARMDLSAVNEVRAAPPAGITSSDVSTQKIPFLVYIDIKGELLTPEISFRLGIEEGAAASQAVASYVNQLNTRKDELDQQVFGLLLFKNFLTGTSANNNNNNVAQTTATNSVSRILNSQLSKLSSKVKGVELSLNLEQNGAPTNSDDPLSNTQLELGLSKQLFNERVVVKVAGNFNLNQSDQNRQQGMNDFAGDIRIEYKLTEDGRYRLVGFRENEYDNLFQGGNDIVKTGVGVIFVRDYDSFRELFNAKDNQEKSDNKKSSKDN
ncbi:translocation/assembly module TamB domain-containing protein [Fulvivirga sediminis]|uniref:Translocation/assembly module TamB n=1 Tax=Fulvivirga sediminis TaxID=2803949 RepID=A0A937JY95_9BACT|nr:translocation/assembly module TamB [Fulvivirga sediminis]MBL3655449.1 translocation/assembly module TamB [Fulvivirga sediminis]